MDEPRQRGWAHVELELIRGAEPIEGRIRDPAGSESAFTGWLELIGALQRIGDVEVAAEGGPERAPRYWAAFEKDFGGVHDAKRGVRGEDR